MRERAGTSASAAHTQAFDVLARRDKGVVDLVWRKVDCATRKNSVTSYQPAM